jgi:catechol 2,3-dioxygenase-like lactoylglutathione lyase family enzyme
MLDHISLRVVDYDKALAFYKAALAPIGYQVVMEFPGFAGLGEKGKPDLWITKTDKAVNPTHVAFRVDRGRVDAFHAAALAAGGTDTGAPGLRSQYHPNYYGAFVLDPEGNNVEAVCHDAPGAAKFAAEKISAATERLKAAGRKLKAAVKGGKAPAQAKAAAKQAAGKAKQAAGKAKQAAGKASGAMKGKVQTVRKAAGKAAGKAKAKVKAATKKR